MVYVLQQLRIHKRIYAIQELELVAAIFVLRIWRHYFYGSKFEAFGNHKSLEYLFGLKE